jgi:hypothetical protein
MEDMLGITCERLCLEVNDVCSDGEKKEKNAHKNERRYSACISSHDLVPVHL